MNRGITLIELLAVTVVLGVLAVFGIPTYQATVKRQRCQTIHSSLLAVYTGERLYFNRNENYLTANPMTTAYWQLLGIDGPMISTCEFAITSPDPFTSFTASATHYVTGDVWMTVNQDRAFASPSGDCDI